MPKKNCQNLFGLKIGALKIIEFSREKRVPKKFKQKNGLYREASEIEYIWICRCECGNRIEKSHKYLLNKRRKHTVASCGCHSYDFLLSRKLEVEHTAFVTLYCRYRAKARMRKIPFYLTKGEAKKLFESECFYCGQPPRQKQQRASLNGYYSYNGIDRKDSLGDYSIENCVSCCKHCNMAKGAMSLDEFLSWVEKVYKNRELWTESTNKNTSIFLVAS